MKVFEFHFNPKLEKETIFDTFYYEPENVYEKRLGYLFLAGELTKVLPQNVRFLKNLARVIKTNFYNLKANLPQTALKKSLKEANQFLERIVREGDVSWISNLNFVILNLSPEKTKKKEIGRYKLNFTKVGDIRIFLARTGKILDIGGEAGTEEIEPYPLKIFFNIISGRVAKGDRILIMTKEVARIFLAQKITEKIVELPSLNNKNLSRILKEVEKTISGICLLVDLDEDEKKRLTKKIVSKQKFSPFKKTIKFSLSKFYLPKISRLSFPALPSLSKLPKFPKLPKPFPELPPFKLSKKLTKINLLLKEPRRPSFLRKKNIFLILGFVLFIFLGSIVAKIEEKKEIARIELKIKEIQEKLDEGDNFLLLNQKKKANQLFSEAFEEVNLIKKRGTIFEDEINQLEEDIQDKLFDVNKLEVVESPALVFDFSEKEFLPQKMILFGDKIYFFSPETNNVLELSNSGESRLLEGGAKFNRAASIDEAVLFFSPSEQQIFPFKDAGFGKSFSLESLAEDFEFRNFASFKSNLYFLDSKGCRIIKYPYQGSLKWGSPQVWSKDEALTCSGAGSMAIDGAIWILREENLLEKYYAGKFKKAIKIDIFPPPQNFTKIWTSPELSCLYILEPAARRIIIVDKEGQIVKQYQSEKFDNLKDFAVSKDEKKIYLLNNEKLYQLLLNF